MQVYPVFLPNLGCPHRCLFCAQERSTSAVAPAPEELRQRLEAVLPEQGDGEIAFYGGTFTLLPAGVMASYLDVARAYVAARRIRGIRISTRPDALDQSVVEQLVAYGVSTVEIGGQSFADPVLHASRRGHCAGDTVGAVARCRAAGMKVGLQLMPGLPGADEREAVSSVTSALALSPDFMRIYPTVVLEGTELAALWRAGGYAPWSLEQAVDVCAVLWLLCWRAQVPVVRMGLQQDPALAANLLAGPFHPAFGQLVRSKVWRLAFGRIPDVRDDLQVNPHDLSDALGHAGQNRVWFVNRWPHYVLRPNPAVARGVVQSCGRTWSVNELAAEVLCHA